MPMESMEKYVRFCAEQPHLPIFYQPFYLDITCNLNWDAAVLEKAGRVIAIWPYYKKEKGPVTYITMPHLTKFMGPWMPTEQQNSRKYYRICRELLDQMPAVSVFKQNFHYSIDNWMPFFHAGFTQTTRYSYQLDLTQSEPGLLAGLCSDYRNNKIPRASKELTLDTKVLPTELLELVRASYQRQGLALPFKPKLFHTIDGALNERGSRQILGARDERGRLHAAIYLIWDQHTAYDLLAGDDPDFRRSGAGIWLTWQAILFSKKVLQVPVFDFLGSMKPSIERVRQNFGAIPVPYFHLTKYRSGIWKILDQLKNRYL